MYEISLQDSEMIGGGIIPVILGVIGLGIAVAGNAQAIYDGFTGFFEGFAAAQSKQ